MENEFKISDDLLASTWQRFFHYFVDTIVIYTIIFIIIFLIAFICALLGLNSVVGWFDSLELGWYLIYFSFMIGYYVLFEGFFSRSVAKFITKTIVVNEDGSKPDFGTIFRRTLCRIIPFEPLSFFGGRGWHDTIPEIYVVKKSLFLEKKELFHSFDQIGEKEEQNN
jgi:uncharacterized RDD family membrane protein YckC